MLLLSWLELHHFKYVNHLSLALVLNTERLLKTKNFQVIVNRKEKKRKNIVSDANTSQKNSPWHQNLRKLSAFSKRLQKAGGNQWAKRFNQVISEFPTWTVVN